MAFLSSARDRVVVLRRGDQDRVGARRSPRAARCTGSGRVVLVVLVERRDRLQPVELDQLGPGRQQLARRPEQLGVVRVSPQASPRCPRMRMRSSLRASSSSTISLTSLASAKPPLGSGAFQFRPNSVRSMIASSVEADLLDVAERHGRARERAAGLDRVRVALDRQLAVDDQLVAVARGSPWRSKRISGWRSVSKNSGDLQVRGQVLVLDDDRVGLDGAVELVPSSSTVSVASNSSKRPRKVETTMCLTANETVEWTGRGPRSPRECELVAVMAACDFLLGLVSGPWSA